MTDRFDLGLKDTSSAGCSCCAVPASAADTAVATAPAVTEEVLVWGMTCAHCVSSVTEELIGIEGVQNVIVDLHAGGASRVTIHSSTPISTSAVQPAVEEAGYTLADSQV
ncbi:heavy-metal-associated domain-containing protein [Microbacterium laevaniformans]|jgi:copper chaperone|uniref:Heavy-metal-associated domain-containing protein n=1 Tax=Microbacterium laevaniformans TaxID=36807 RepID=A0A4S2D557_9MICO|nr:heavy metal-associated domain-containing protein [Microbacterium laevaniformans]EIC06565.1 Heavy metal transport/detoxification protein [Microbacterium laevaniformans OR221]TGY36182.1 heavy-metal-associated domain-containing protein [Microbacterium laevaniformans]